MSLIISDVDNVNLTEAILGDDGTGGGIRIPALMMSKEDGSKIIDWLARASPSELASIELHADF